MLGVGRLGGSQGTHALCGFSEAGRNRERLRARTLLQACKVATVKDFGREIFNSVCFDLFSINLVFMCALFQHRVRYLAPRSDFVPHERLGEYLTFICIPLVYEVYYNHNARPGFRDPLCGYENLVSTLGIS